jgi:hypothetical protein
MSVEFFRFVRGAETWRFSTLAESVVADGHTWLPAPIQRGQVEIATTVERSSVTLSVMRNFAPVAIFAGTAPRETTYVTIYRAEVGLVASTFAALWHGQIASVRWSGSYADIDCQPTLGLLQRTSPRKRYSVSCRWALYDSGCGVNRNALANYRTGEITLVETPTRIHISTFEDASPDPEHWARGGTLQLTSAAGAPIETVISSTVSVIVGAVRERIVELARPMDAMGFGETIRLQRGCGHTFANCSDFFNTPRFGGFPYIPQELAP